MKINTAKLLNKENLKLSLALGIGGLIAILATNIYSPQKPPPVPQPISEFKLSEPSLSNSSGPSDGIASFRTEIGGPSGELQTEFQNDFPRKLVKTGNLNLFVEEIEKSIQAIKNIAKTNGGYVQYLNVYEPQKNQKEASITIKIPEEKFDKVFDEIKSIAVKVSRASINVNDVTEAYRDLKIRLESLKREEKRYLEILDQAKTVEEILKVTDYLERTRQKIELTEAQLQNLERQINYSALYINLKSKEEIKIIEGILWEPLSVIKKETRNLLKNIIDYVNLLIKLIINLPIIILWGITAVVLIIIAKYLWQKIKRLI